MSTSLAAHQKALSNAEKVFAYLYPTIDDADGYDTELDSDKTYDSVKKKQRDRLKWLITKLFFECMCEADVNNSDGTVKQKGAVIAGEQLLEYLTKKKKTSKKKRRIIEDLQSWIKTLGQRRTAAVQAAATLHSYLSDTKHHQRFYNFVSFHDGDRDLIKFMAKVTKTASLDGMKIDTRKMLEAARNNVKLPEAITSVQRLMLYLDKRMKNIDGKKEFRNLSMRLSHWISNAVDEVTNKFDHVYGIYEYDFNHKLWWAALELTMYIDKNKNNMQGRVGRGYR